MQSILKIREDPLTSKSMLTFGFRCDGPVDPLVDSDDESETAIVSAEHARWVFQYYATDPSKRDAALYEKGCAHVACAVNALYEGFITDNTWSDRSLQLFEAVNCGNIVKVAAAAPTIRASDVHKRGRDVCLPASDLVVLEVHANARLYWERERELHAYSLEKTVRYTAADPGPYTEYERRFHEAAEDESIGHVKVAVRKLLNGDAVREMVSAKQKFVVERAVQYGMVQGLYELCVWQFSVQAEVVADWKSTTSAEDWADKINKKVKLVRLLSHSQPSSQPHSTVHKMNEDRENVKKAVKGPTKFDRFYAESKKNGSPLTKKELRVKFDQLSPEEKLTYGNGDASREPPKKRKKPDASTNAADIDPFEYTSDDDVNPKEKAEPAVVKKKVEVNEVTTDDDDSEGDEDYDVADPDDGEGVDDDDEEPATQQSPPTKKKKVIKVVKDIKHELAAGSKEHFLWEMLNDNMAAMTEARRAFTAFEDTPFEQAYVEWTNQKGKMDDAARFKAAKKKLGGINGIVYCFQMFNLLFKSKNATLPPVEDDCLFG